MSPSCLQQYLQRWQTITIWSGVVVLYCPEQVLVGARNSSAKIWGWAVTPDTKLVAMGPNRLALLVRLCFVKASPTVEKAVSCYKADRLIASLLNFCSVQSLAAVREFHARRNTVNQATDRCVRTWCRGTRSASELCELSRPTFRFTMQELAWWVVTQRTLKNYKTAKSGGGGCLLRTIRYMQFASECTYIVVCELFVN